jgi:hypothetical protein
MKLTMNVVGGPRKPDPIQEYAAGAGDAARGRKEGEPKEFLAANPANPANGCRRFGRLSLVVGSPYATLRVYQKATPSG